MPTALSYPPPAPSASLLLSFNLQRKTALIIGGSTPLSASRAFSALEADSSVVVLTKGGLGGCCEEIKWREKEGQLTVLDWGKLPGGALDNNEGADPEGLEQRLDQFLSTRDTQHSSPIQLACITDTLSTSPHRRPLPSAQRIYAILKRHHILVNTTDVPSLCDFSFMATHRFSYVSNDEEKNQGTTKKSSLQIGITTNGQGCRIGSRLKREVASTISSMHPEIGKAVDNLGRMRILARERQVDDTMPICAGTADDDGMAAATPNVPTPTSSPHESTAERIIRRLAWMSQISEFWPISQLADLDEEKMKAILDSSPGLSPMNNSTSSTSGIPSLHDLHVTAPATKSRGCLYLAGSGPGNPELLTLSTLHALKSANLVLADKLVPQSILKLIPNGVEVKIAKKYPGNAEGAMKELLEDGLEGLEKGQKVVRLKQGDPCVFARTSEEIDFFTERGYPPILIPGVSSALGGPLLAGIPLTQRGASDSFIVVSGVGRGGTSSEMPGYERGRMVVLLMGIARLEQITSSMLNSCRGDKATYPPYIPTAIIERASLSDQRIILSTLGNIVKALDASGEQRPPGIVLIGWGVLTATRVYLSNATQTTPNATGSLPTREEADILSPGSEVHDHDRVKEWLGPGKSWNVREGLSAAHLGFSEGWKKTIDSSFVATPYRE